MQKNRLSLPIGALVAIGVGVGVATGWFRGSTAAVIIDPPAPLAGRSSSTSEGWSVPSAPSVPSSESSESVESSESSSLPPSVLLRVPFGAQAPHGNWDPPYDEACEEASLILAQAFFADESNLSAQEMDRRILELVDWETRAGLPIDITMAQLKDVAAQRYGLKTTLVDDPSVDDIKQALAAGHPVIVPLAGQDIGNPYYSGDGPPYHVLVIIGYDERNFITQDVGTKRGEQYAYRYDVIMSALHDWTGSTATIRTGAKRALIIEG